MTSVRLNKFLATHHGLSRRQADEKIASGEVLVNGIAARIGQTVGPNDHISVDDQSVTTQQTTLLALHKPIGFVCSRRQQGDSPTIYSLLPEHYHSLKTVGRLDRDSSGIILLTNNGDLAHQMMHPQFHKTKAYQVDLDQPLAPLHQQMISDFGIQLDDGVSQLHLTRQKEGDNTHWNLTMHEGRNRQIRRTFAALGYTVTKLHRTDFGNYSLGDIKCGKFEIIKML